jgi:hypothetical protein
VKFYAINLIFILWRYNMTRTKSSRALLSVVLAVLMAAAFMPSLTYSSFAATAKKATKVTKASHADKAKFTRTVGTAWTLKYKLSPSKLTSSAKKVTWKSSNSKVAKITTIKSGKAVVSFKSTGSATVTVATKANPKAKTSWKFKVVNKKAVKKVAATGVTVAADNTTDYTKTLEAGTTLTATVAPADATGVTYQWYADDQPISGATSQKFKVTTDQIGKAITVKATDDSKNTVASTASAKVSDVSLKGVTLNKVTDGKVEENPIDANQEYPVGTVLSVQGNDLTGASKLSDIAGIKWIRTIYSANGTAQDTTVAENTNTYTVTKADLAAVQKDAKVRIKAEVTPNTGVKAYGTTSGKYTTSEIKINGDLVVSIQANGKDVNGKNIKLGTKLTAVTTPSDVKVSYQWYKDGVAIKDATSAEYTPTEKGLYRVHVTVDPSETTYNKATADAYANVGGNVVENVQITATLDDAQGTQSTKTATAKSKITLQALYLNDGTKVAPATGTVDWYINGVKVASGSAEDQQTLDLNNNNYKVDLNSDVYATFEGNDKFVSEKKESNHITVNSLGYIKNNDMKAKLSKDGVLTVSAPTATNSVGEFDLSLVDGKGTNEKTVDPSVHNATKEEGEQYSEDLSGKDLYVKMTAKNGWSGTDYIKVDNKQATQKAEEAAQAAVQAEADKIASEAKPVLVHSTKDNATYQNVLYLTKVSTATDETVEYTSTVNNQGVRVGEHAIDNVKYAANFNGNIADKDLVGKAPVVTVKVTKTINGNTYIATSAPVTANTVNITGEAW